MPLKKEVSSIFTGSVNMCCWSPGTRRGEVQGWKRKGQCTMSWAEWQPFLVWVLRSLEMEMKMGSNKEEDETKWPLSTRILFFFFFQNLLTTKLLIYYPYTKVDNLWKKSNYPYTNRLGLGALWSTCVLSICATFLGVKWDWRLFISLYFIWTNHDWGPLQFQLYLWQKLIRSLVVHVCFVSLCHFSWSNMRLAPVYMNKSQMRSPTIPTLSPAKIKSKK